MNQKRTVFQKYISALVLLVTLSLSFTLQAQDGKALFNNKCASCHAIDKKLVGPSYQDVAKKYGGQKDAAANLAKSIKAGGSGKWGPVPMPAQAALSDADALTLATWILAGAK